MRSHLPLQELVRGLDGAARPAGGPIAGRVLAISSLIGFSYGVFVKPSLLQSVDAALIASGMLPLPKSNPAYVWATTSYSLYSIQIPALLLKLGAPPLKLCVLFSGLQAAVATSAVAAWTLLLSRNWPLAVSMPFVFMHLQFSGHKYPIFFPLSEYDPGSVGFYATLLTLALLGLRLFHIAAFLIGLMPAVHPVWALSCWLTVGLTLLKGPRRLKCLRPSIKYFLAGLAVVLVSYAFQRVVIQDSDRPPADPQLVSRYQEAFRQTWDTHQQPAGFEHDPVRLVRFFESDLYFWGLCLAFVRFFPGAAPRGLRFLLAGLVGSSVLEAAWVVVDELVPTLFPFRLKMLIVARLLNVDAILYPLLVVSGLAQLVFRRRNLAGAILLIALLALLHFDVISRTTVFRYTWTGLKSRDPLWDPRGLAFPVSALALFALLGLHRLRQLRPGEDSHGRAAARTLWPRRLATAVILTFAGHASVPLLASAYHQWRYGSVEDLRGGAGKRAVYAAAARGRGVLIVPPDEMTDDEKWPQLKAERPVLLNFFTMDVLTYAPQAAPAMEDILETVYGASLYKAEYPDVRRLWEARPREGWRKIRERFEATDVLVPFPWTLQLPETAHSRALVLYHIPEDENVSERQ